MTGSGTHGLSELQVKQLRWLLRNMKKQGGVHKPSMQRTTITWERQATTFTSTRNLQLHISKNARLLADWLQSTSNGRILQWQNPPSMGPPDMHMSWRLYLPALAALNLISTSCPSSVVSGSMMTGSMPLTGATALLIADSAPGACPSRIFWMVAKVFGLDSNDVAGASAAEGEGISFNLYLVWFN